MISTQEKQDLQVTCLDNHSLLVTFPLSTFKNTATWLADKTTSSKSKHPCPKKPHEQGQKKKTTQKNSFHLSIFPFFFGYIDILL